MAYSPNVERWRSLVEKYFPPELVDKALYVIQGESGGDPGARGDNGVAIGLFQIQDKTNFSNRPDATYLSDPEKNIAYAAQQLGGASGNFSAWGEGSLHNGKPFGALGNNPYPGDSGTTGARQTMAGGKFYQDPSMDAEFDELRKERQAAFTSWVNAGRPADGDEWYALDDAQARFDNWVQSHESFRIPYEDPTRQAEDAFDNAIRLGDYNLRQADSAFSRWLNKTEAARAAATAELSARRQHNEDNVALQEARNTSQTPGMLPRVTDAGYMEVGFDKLFDDYKRQYGVEGQFDPDTVPGGPPMPVAGGTPSLDVGTPVADTTWRPDYSSMLAPRQGEAPASSSAEWAPGNPFKVAGGPYSLLEGRPGQMAAAPREMDAMGALGLTASSAAAGYQRLGGDLRKAGSKAKNTVTPWWKRVSARAFADGGKNLPAGRGWVGDGGAPEILEVAGFGSKIVGANGPEEIDIPEGANIIPLDEAMAYQQVRQATMMPAQNAASSPQAQAERAADPQLQAKVMASIRKAMAANMAAHPPYTPMMPPGVKDYFASERQLSGVPAQPIPAEAVRK